MATTALSWPLLTGRCSLAAFDSQPSAIRCRHPLLHRYGWNPLVKPCNAKGFLVVKLSLQQIPDPEHLNELVDGAAQGFVDRTERLLYSLADAAAQKQDGDWLAGLTNTLESILKVLKDALSTMHVPYAYGFAIILLTVLVKAATFPLTKKQVESTMSMQNLQPQIKAIQQQYAGDQERIQLETARLYRQAGVNPLAGCLPTLATIPVWIGLYRALSNVANEGLLTEGFFWIPSLAGPTTIAARQNGSGISWLFPFVDGHPPLGWSDTLAYLVLPVLLIVSQYISMQIMQPPQANDPSQKNTQAILKFLPLMVGYFALSVPSGLSLYWLTNNILSTTQQVWLRKLGGAKPVVEKTGGRITTAEKEKRPPAQLVVDSKEIRRGERFKQLKAEEAKRRKEREEAAKRAAERAAEGASKAVANVSQHEQLHNTQNAEKTQSTDSSTERLGHEEGHSEQASNSSMGKYVQSAEETETTDSSTKSDGHNRDEESHYEQPSNSTLAKESLEEFYSNNGSEATSDSLEPKRSEQSKQRGAA